ncbi:MAG TPA: RNA polymerase sigma factor [Bacteroidales bacterium]|nr:RNA polymerase sigma factor [Bacteroidales bacterium]
MNIFDYNKTVDLYADALFRFVLKNIKNKEKAEDIVQDSFEKMWKNIDKIDAQKAKSYLFTTAYHGFIDVIRKEKRTTSYEPEHEKLQVYHSPNHDLQEILHQAIDKLPPDQKAVVLLRDYEGYSYKEIAEITELSEAQVKVYIFRARTFLKDYIGNISVLI